MSSEPGPILYVEDNVDDVLFFRMALKRTGCPAALRVARDGDEAVAFLRGTEPRPLLIVLDIKIPGPTGLEVLAWVREDPTLRGIPVVMLTSSREERDIARARELGAADYLVKPTEFPRLVGILEGIALRWTRLAATEGTST